MSKSKTKSLWAQGYRNIDEPHVKKAIEEYDRFGEKAFLKKYKFRTARSYFLYEDGKYYASKAIAAVAYGHAHPKNGPLKHNSTSMSGGDRGATKVVSVLKKLGFEIRDKKGPNIGRFDPEKIGAGKKKRQILVKERRGQPEFRRRLLKTYNRKCAVSGCGVDGLLEAAHIIPYSEDLADANHPGNGLLLRADLHTAFDQGLLAVNPETMKITLAPALRKDKDYKEFHGKKLKTPHPEKAALEWHWKKAAKAAVKK